MNRRTFLTTAGIAATSTIGLAGCIGTASGTLATRVSDRPGDIGDFESCVVTISGIWAKPVDGELTKQSIEATEADLTELQGEASALVDEVPLSTGEYEFLQLKISETRGTLASGEEATVEVPGDAPLKFNHGFEIREGETTTFTADFTPVKAGGSGRYLLQPVADEVTVSYVSERDSTSTNDTTTAETTSTDTTTSTDATTSTDTATSA